MFFLAAFGCFLGAIRGLRFPPWRKITFPDIKIDVYGGGFEVTERVINMPGASSDIVTNEMIQLFMVRVVNMEAEQNASLTVRLYAKLAPGSFGYALEMICTPPDWKLSLALDQNQIQMPIGLEPGTAVGGYLPYVMTSYFSFANPFTGDLELEDHVTGKRVRIPANGGKFDKRTMVPSSGGIRFSEARNVTQELPSIPFRGSPEWPPLPFSGIVRFFRQIFPSL